MAWTLSAFADEAGGTTDEQIAALKRAGYSCIDPRSLDGHSIVELPTDAAEAAQKKYEAAGITVQMYGSPIGKIDIADDIEIDLKRLDHLGEMKKIFGCDKVRMFSYYNKNGASKAEWKTKTIDYLNRLRERAGKLGLKLYHENESEIYGDASPEILELAELRDGETFFLIYDFANYIRTGEAGWDTWQKMKNITDWFHFKDQKKTGEHLPMGQGDTDSDKILADAYAAGWQGVCTLEPHLTHSDAVLATHSTGTGAQSLKDMPPAETFHIAAEGATQLLTKLGIEFK